MRKAIEQRLFLATGVAALLSLGGCVYPAGYYDGGPYYDGGYYDDDYYYDGFYDGYYGPYGGGYWAVDGFFYYWLNDRYYRDDRRHFRRDHFPGAFRFRGDRDGPKRWSRRGQQYHQDHQQLPPQAHPPRDRSRPRSPHQDHR